MPTHKPQRTSRRAVVIAGARTPFVKAFGDFLELMSEEKARALGYEPLAFAVQVLSVLKMLGSRGFAQARLGRERPVGEVDPERLNVHGGSIALGHPFGATGARMVTPLANELKRTGKRTALLGICAAGGLGAAAVLEAVGE
jgi:acetyl-CoA acetyltransferase